jgi:hypothetical protein
VQVDEQTRRNEAPPDDIVLWSALLLEPLLECVEGQKDRTRAAHEFLEPIVERLNLPRKMSDAMVRIVAMLPRLESGKSARMRKSALLPFAQQIHELRSAALESLS